MYICLCRGLTTEQIAIAVCMGACCNKDVNEIYGMKPKCGQCGPNMKCFIKELLITRSAEYAQTAGEKQAQQI